MKSFLSRISRHAFETHTAALLLMLLPAVPLYLAAQQGATGWIWPLIGIIVLGNLLVLAVK